MEKANFALRIDLNLEIYGDNGQKKFPSIPLFFHCFLWWPIENASLLYSQMRNLCDSCSQSFSTTSNCGKKSISCLDVNDWMEHAHQRYGHLHNHHQGLLSVSLCLSVWVCSLFLYVYASLSPSLSLSFYCCCIRMQLQMLHGHFTSA